MNPLQTTVLVLFVLAYICMTVYMIRSHEKAAKKAKVVDEVLTDLERRSQAIVTHLGAKDMYETVMAYIKSTPLNNEQNIRGMLILRYLAGKLSVLK